MLAHHKVMWKNYKIQTARATIAFDYVVGRGEITYDHQQSQTFCKSLQLFALIYFKPFKDEHWVYQKPQQVQETPIYTETAFKKENIPPFYTLYLNLFTSLVPKLEGPMAP